MVAEEPIVVREFDADRDCPGVEAVERVCEIGSSGSGKLALLTDLLGDPICRVRHSPAFLMLVAETSAGAAREIVGVIRGCVKTVTCGKRTPRNGKAPVALYTKVAYVLGLRVSPSHR
ncbi:hypothetical protein Taro_027740 [Colocasia esculenta]|uniref:Uncharacterized protein n=1 Tax=Colocasia esculenta TaxID=4460 RepID=A0A843V9G8_COLES|nr:hypothetical protein [Colocasia esculenta]